MNTSDDDEMYMNITIDKNFIANSITSMLHMRKDLPDNEYLTVEFLETDGDYFNIIAKRNAIIVN